MHVCSLFYFGQIFSALVVMLLPDPESQEQCLIFIFELICEGVNVDIVLMLIYSKCYRPKTFIYAKVQPSEVFSQIVCIIL